MAATDAVSSRNAVHVYQRTRSFRSRAFVAMLAGPPIVAALLVVTYLRAKTAHGLVSSLAIVALAWLGEAVLVARTPFEITLDDASGTVRFRARLRTVVFRIHMIDSITGEWPGGSVAAFRTPSRTVRVPVQYEGFPDLLSRIKAASPRTEIRRL